MDIQGVWFNDKFYFDLNCLPTLRQLVSASDGVPSVKQWGGITGFKTNEKNHAAIAGLEIPPEVLVEMIYEFVSDNYEDEVTEQFTAKALREVDFTDTVYGEYRVNCNMPYERIAEEDPTFESIMQSTKTKIILYRIMALNETNTVSKKMYHYYYGMTNKAARETIDGTWYYYDEIRDEQHYDCLKQDERDNELRREAVKQHKAEQEENRRKDNYFRHNPHDTEADYLKAKFHPFGYPL